MGYWVALHPTTQQPIPPTTTSILRDLVAFPILGGEPNGAIIDYIEGYLASLGVTSTRVPSPDEPQDKAGLHARIGPAVDGGVILSGHTDVVPVEGQDWTSDPFALTERDGRLYGRGACDMKGFLACVLAAVPTLLAAELSRPVYLCFSYDEEIGCVSGRLMADAIREHYAERPAACIVGEPSMLQPVVGHKGIAVYKVIVRGSAGHSSRIRTEVSAVHEAARLVGWCEDYMEGLIARGALDERFDPPHTSVHVGQLHGGTAHNIVADEAWFTVDIRNIPADAQGDVVDDLRAAAKTQEAAMRERFANASIEVAPYHPAVPPLDTPADSPAIDLAARLSGRRDTTAVSYAAEAGQFANAGFATVICGPGDIAQAHRADEFISVEQLRLGLEMIERLASVG